MQSQKLQVLMVTLGEELEEYELQEILDKFAMDGSGLLTFREFLYMMKDWKNKVLTHSNIYVV